MFALHVLPTPHNVLQLQRVLVKRATLSMVNHVQTVAVNLLIATNVTSTLAPLVSKNTF